MSRVLIHSDPGLDLHSYKFGAPPWPAKWIGPATFDLKSSFAFACRLRFSLATTLDARIHVSADQRYELFLDGQRLGRGPERGDLRNWFYESYDLHLEAGEHTLAARCYWLSPDDMAPEAQLTVRPGFLLYAEGDASPLLSTGAANWHVKVLDGYRFAYPHRMGTYVATGARLIAMHERIDWRPDAPTDGSTGWSDAAVVGQAALLAQQWQSEPYWLLRPALLPAMLDTVAPAPTIRYVAACESVQTWKEVVQDGRCLQAEIPAWQAMAAGGQGVTVPPHTRRRILLDLNDYRCFYPELEVSGGKGSCLTLTSAESLFIPRPDAPDPRFAKRKGNRSEIDGRVFFGIGDTHYPSGGECLCDAHWWLAGRYVEVCVGTADEPLEVKSLRLRETHYPYQFESRFHASDARLAELIPLALRTLEMCSHETSMDCPFYEQLNYVGDTRLQALVAMASSRDDRLVRKCIELFDVSRTTDGFTSSRYPTRTLQTIPTFSLWWVMKVHDYAMWRNDLPFVRERMAGVRAVMERWRKQVRQDGLVESPRGWNFCDWVPNWPKGMAPGAASGQSAILHWQLCLASSAAAALERLVGEPLLAQRHEELAWQLAQTAQDSYWDAEQGLFADDASHQHFSEHAQCLAVLTGMIPESQAQLVMQGIMRRDDLARTTIYFTHYLFEACRRTGQVAYLLERLRLWFDHRAQGFCTTMESPEPSRSDCHAWGAHPVFHYYATILGIRPAAPGFERVQIRPQLGELTAASGIMVHPRGDISVTVRRSGGRTECEVTLPPGLRGELVLGNRRTQLRPGRQLITSRSRRTRKELAP
jgi:hypothetical protein